MGYCRGVVPMGMVVVDELASSVHGMYYPISERGTVCSA